MITVSYTHLDVYKRQMLAQVIGEDGHITIPHFYDDVEKVPAAEREMIAQMCIRDRPYSVKNGRL